jgi:hypothetical protein
VVGGKNAVNVMPGAIMPENQNALVSVGVGITALLETAHWRKE